MESYIHLYDNFDDYLWYNDVWRVSKTSINICLIERKIK